MMPRVVKSQPKVVRKSMLKVMQVLKEMIGQSLTSTKYQMMSMTSQMRKTRKS